MNEDEKLTTLLRSALPAATRSEPGGDLWLRVHERIAPAGPSWFDLALAAAVGVLLFVFPEWIYLLAYQM